MQLWESIALIKSFTAHLIERIEKNTVPTLDIKKEDQNTIERLALYFGGCLINNFLKAKCQMPAMSEEEEQEMVKKVLSTVGEFVAELQRKKMVKRHLQKCNHCKKNEI